MFDLNIDFSALEEVSKAISLKAEEFSQLLNNIKSANNELTNAWQGTNAGQYTQKVADQAAVMEKLNLAISEVGQQLLKIKEIYASVESDTTLR